MHRLVGPDAPPCLWGHIAFSAPTPRVCHNRAVKDRRRYPQISLKGPVILFVIVLILMLTLAVLWSVVLVWSCGHWVNLQETQLDRAVLVSRFFGAVIMMAAIVLALTWDTIAS